MAWVKIKPADSEKLKDTPSIIRANFEAIELGTDAALQITNAKVAADAGIVDTKLAEIATANKVNASALKNLAGTPSGAGSLPVANVPDLAATKITSGTMSADRLPVGTTANKILQLDSNAKIPAVDGSQLTNIKPTDLAIASQARGDLLYFDGTNWKRLAKGDNGQFLKIGANDPTWTSPPAYGEWANKSSDYGAQQATTDGEVFATIEHTAGQDVYKKLEGYTDNAKNPTIRICGCSAGYTYPETAKSYPKINSFSMKVRKNDYWKVVATDILGTGTYTITVYWLPLGS